MVNYVASSIGKTNLLHVLFVFEVKKSISDMFTELPCSRDLENLGQLPVLLPFRALIADTDALVACISVISPVFMFSRSRNPFFCSFTELPYLGDLENPGPLPVCRCLGVLIIRSYGFS